VYNTIEPIYTFKDPNCLTQLPKSLPVARYVHRPETNVPNPPTQSACPTPFASLFDCKSLETLILLSGSYSSRLSLEMTVYHWIVTVLSFPSLHLERISCNSAVHHSNSYSDVSKTFFFPLSPIVHSYLVDGRLPGCWLSYNHSRSYSAIAKL